MLVFPLADVAEMTRGKGVILQRIKDGALSDARAFIAKQGLSWHDAAGRTFTLGLFDLAEWRGERAQANRLHRKGSRARTVSDLHLRRRGALVTTTGLHRPLIVGSINGRFDFASPGPCLIAWRQLQAVCVLDNRPVQPLNNSVQSSPKPLCNHRTVHNKQHGASLR